MSAAGLAASVLLAFILFTTPPPSTRFVVVLVAPSSQAAGWVVQASDNRMIELIPLGQDAVPEGMALQFWTKGEQWRAPVSLGLVKPGEPYRIPLQTLPPLEANQLFELTLESRRLANRVTDGPGEVHWPCGKSDMTDSRGRCFGQVPLAHPQTKISIPA